LLSTINVGAEMGLLFRCFYCQ